MIQRYVVSAMPRSGSHMVADLIKSAGYPTLHTHNPFLETDDDSITALIITGRRDLFSAIMSNCIAWHTNQYTDYENTNIDAFVVTRSQLKLHYRKLRWYKASHDATRQYGLVRTIYYEDFVNTPDYIFETLNITQQPDLANKNFVTTPAPYNYKNIVSNHAECREWFDHFEQHGSMILYNKSWMYFGQKELNEKFEL